MNEEQKKYHEARKRHDDLFQGIKKGIIRKFEPRFEALKVDGVIPRGARVTVESIAAERLMALREAAFERAVAFAEEMGKKVPTRADYDLPPKKK